jgi:hypothetical protein
MTRHDGTDVVIVNTVMRWPTRPQRRDSLTDRPIS